MAVLWAARWSGAAIPVDRLTSVHFPLPSAPRALSPPNTLFSDTQAFTGDSMGNQNQPKFLGSAFEALPSSAPTYHSSLC